MDIVAAIVTHTEPAELMKPTDRSLHHPAIHTQAAAVGRPPLGQLRVDPAVPQLLPLLFVIKAPVPHHMVRAFPGVAGLAGDRRNGIHQRHGLIGVRSVRRDGIDDQGHALTVGENRVFAAQFRAIDGAGTRLSSLCSFRTLYFTPESGPATEGFSCRGAVMNDEGNAARKIRKLRASRDLWKQRSAEKQQEIRQLRVTVRDLSSSRENWKTRVKELEQQLQAAHEAHAAVGPGSWIFFGGLMDNQAMPRTRRTPITLSSD